MKVRNVVVLTVILALSTTFVFANGSSENAASTSTTLTVWIPGNDVTVRQTFLNLLSAYEKNHPTVKSQLQLIPWSDYFTKLNAAFAGGAAPDVFGLGYGQAGPVQTNGNLLALNGYLKNWSGWTDIPKNILDAGTVNGTLYAIMMPDIKLLWYRPDLFRKAGLDPSHGPRTITELKQAVKQLTQRDANGELKMAGFEVLTTNGEQGLAEAMLMYGDVGLWDNNLQPLWDTKEGISALTLLNGFIQSKESFYSDQQNVAGAAFQNGLAAVAVESFGNRVVYDRTIGADKVAFDVPPGGLAQSGATFLCVSAKTKEKQQAVDLLDYFTSGDGQKAIFKGAGFIPTRESLKSWFTSQDPAYSAAWKAMENARVYGVMNPHFFDVLKVLRPALESVYYGKDTVDHAMKQSADAYRAILKK